MDNQRRQKEQTRLIQYLSKLFFAIHGAQNTIFVHPSICLDYGLTNMRVDMYHPHGYNTTVNIGPIPKIYIEKNNDNALVLGVVFESATMPFPSDEPRMKHIVLVSNNGIGRAKLVSMLNG